MSVTVGEQIEALRAIAGAKTVSLIRREPDETIARIVAGWPRDFDPAAGEKPWISRRRRLFCYNQCLYRGRTEDLNARADPCWTSRLEAKAARKRPLSPKRWPGGPRSRPPPAPWRGLGLAGRVLAVTLTFVLLAMGLFYLTRLSSYRETWLHAKIASAQTAIESFDAAGPVPPPEDLSRRILNSVGVKSITVLTPAGRRELALPGATPATAEVIAADDNSYVEGVAATFRTLFTGPRHDREGRFFRAAG